MVDDFACLDLCKGAGNCCLKRTSASQEFEVDLEALYGVLERRQQGRFALCSVESDWSVSKRPRFGKRQRALSQSQRLSVDRLCYQTEYRPDLAGDEG